MRVLVTGCHGFIGAEVCAQLLDRGDEVVGADDMNPSYDRRLKEWRAGQLRGRPRFESQLADIARQDDVAGLFERGPFDAVIHLAARAGVRQSLVDPLAYVEVNVTGTLRLLEASRASHVRTFVLASTSSLYGALNPRPFREDSPTDRPLSPYAATKKAAEALAASYAHLYGLNVPVLRFFTVYGPAGRPDMAVFRFVRWIAEGEPVRLFGDGSQERDFTYVADVARGTVAALDVRGHEVLNVGSDRPVPVSQLIAIIERASGNQARVIPSPMPRADVPATWADIGKARKHLDWEPRVTLEDGIRRCVAWYMAHREWASRIDLGP